MISWSLSEYIRALDETDFHILEFLVGDARHPFSDISTGVGLSVPVVSDRINRLREEGITRRFTVDLDQSTPSGGASVFVRLSVHPEFVDKVRNALRAADPVQRLFVAADGEVTTHARLDGESVRTQLGELVNLSWIHDYEVSLVGSVEWSPTVNGTGFALEYTECDDTATSEGKSTRIGGSLYHFCCSSYLGWFEDRYDRLKAGASNN